MNTEHRDPKHYLIALKNRGDDRGGLGVVEGEIDIPFKLERVFFLHSTSASVTRGDHANLISRFGIVSVAGSCEVEVDDGFYKVTYKLDDPYKLLFLDRMTWKSMRRFTSDNVLLVISDQKYNHEEYIRDYQEFRRIAQELD